MKKKLLPCLLSLVFLVGIFVSGCSSNPTTSTSEAKTEDPPYPTKPINYIVPFGAGGSTDMVARTIAEYVSKEWGQPVNVINKTGAGGATGVQEAVKAKNDGYTVLAQGTSSASALIGGSKSLPFKLEDNLFVSQVVTDSLAFVVKDDAPWKDLKEFSEWVKQNPDKLTFASSGPTAISTIGVAQWLDAIGVDFSKARMVITTGASQSITNVAGGHVLVALHGLCEPAIKMGKVKILASTGKKRSQYYPDVPTAEELGIKMNFEWWSGVAGPVGLPDHVVKKWEDTLAKASKDPAFLEKLKNIAVEPAYLNSADFTKSVTEETQELTALATQKGLRK